MSRRSLTRPVVGLFSATAALVALMFVLLLVSIVNLRDDDSSARRSSDLLSQSLAVERSVVDLETGLRGFLLTRQTRFLQPYTEARARLPEQLRTFQALARPGMEQRSVAAISSAIGAYQTGYAEPSIRTGGRLTSPQAVGITAQGKALLNGLRSQFDAFNTGEAALRAKQRASATSGTSRAIVIAGVGLGGSILLLLALGTYLVRGILGPTRDVAAAAERLAAGNLDARAPELGRGEVRRLASSFNEMASAIQSRDAELSEAKAQLEQAVAAAEEASAMKSNFLANMSHEIRTPLNGVVGMMSLLADTRLTAEQREYIDVARTSSDALMTVVNDVLDIAKIEAGHLEIERRDFDLHDMVETACDMVAASALSKGVELQSYVHDDVPWAVRGDRMRVGQILANQLSNAVKFTADGEVVAEVSVAESTGDTTMVRFEVRDTGIGIAPDRIAGLFEPFAQADSGTTRKFGGTGLGLAISLELTRLMGGRIEAESELGRGSTFRFEIPFAPAQSELRAPVPAAELHGLRVLVVDDNATNRRIFEAYVASWGMRAVIAADAASAFLQLRRAVDRGDPFDLVLLDLNMPDESGLELAERIGASPELRSTRLILLTSSAQTSASDPSAWIDAQLTKPVRQSRLLDAISAAMAVDVHERKQPRGRSGARRARTRPGPTGRRILVAEDQHVNWMLIERMLGKRGHSAVNATDGRQVLEQLAAAPYDLILMDCQMPALDGYDATREIRRREAGERRPRIPIVAMTAHAMEGDRERCLAAGMDDYMAKPITREMLDETLARWLSPSAPGTVVGLDRARLIELRSLFPGEEMSSMLRDLVNEVNNELERLKTAFADRDAAAIGAAAHRIKNSAQMIGARDLAGAATELDRGDPGDGAPDVDEHALAVLLERWAATSAAIAAELARVS